MVHLLIVVFMHILLLSLCSAVIVLLLSFCFIVTRLIVVVFIASVAFCLFLLCFDGTGYQLLDLEPSRMKGAFH
jgi:hypothetical protein